MLNGMELGEACSRVIAHLIAAIEAESFPAQSWIKEELAERTGLFDPAQASSEFELETVEPPVRTQQKGDQRRGG